MLLTIWKVRKCKEKQSRKASMMELHHLIGWNLFSDMLDETCQLATNLHAYYA